LAPMGDGVVRNGELLISHLWSLVFMEWYIPTRF
jgi:hypothetical protein